MVIPIIALPSRDCHACHDRPEGPACRTFVGEVCATPTFHGDPTLVGRVLDSLREVVDPERGINIVDLRLVKSLRIAQGEAELTVTFPPQCGSSRAMAEGAFETLRRTLPDTDVYVLHAA
jgi:hypothetical protein